MKKITFLFILAGFLGTAQNTLNLNLINTWETGIFDESGAEIVAYDPTTYQVFYTNAEDNEIGIIDFSNPSSLTKTEITLPDGGVNSVDCHGGHLAVALEDTNKQANGRVLFYTTSGNLVSQVTVGALPDMVTFSPDGSMVLTANEGEPNDDYTVDPNGSISIIDVSGGVANVSQSDVTTLDFSHFNASNLHQDVRINGNNGNATIAEDIEPEYVAVSSDNKWAYVALQENNAMAVVDLMNDTIVEVVALGFKDWSAAGNELDASDKRNAVFFSSYDHLYGMYMPDAIKFFSVGGTSYIISANEGDGREYNNFEDEVKVKDLTLDATAFPNAATLQEDTVLGRLNVSATEGDTDNDGDFDKLYAFGGRSFSIWSASTGALVYDSGSELEKKTFQEIPMYFNSNNDDNDSFKNRSENKGPEPEAVEVAQIGAYTLAFVGLERVGGIMSFDISNPSSPVYLGYDNNRDFTVDAEDSTAGDLGPEDILYVPGYENPTGKPMLIVANEVSGTVSFFEIQTNFISVDEYFPGKENIEFFPNPTDGRVTASKPSDYTVLDARGLQLRSFENTTQIDLSGLPAGLYLVQSLNGTVYKVVKH